jgi:hypothetical protein
MQNAPGRILLITAGILHIIFSLSSIAGNIGEITVIAYRSMPWPVELPNVSWTLHYWLAVLVSGFNLALGVLAIKFHRTAHRAKLLIILSIAGLVAYTAFVVISGYHAHQITGEPWASPFAFAVPVLLIVGAAMNMFAYKKSGSQT